MLVRVVEIAHRLGIFHRDISISNIFYDSREKSNRNIFLNDWSSAHRTHHLLSSSPVKWVGTPYFSCSRADSYGCHIPTAAEDLCSIVKCAQISYCNQPLLPSSSAAEGAEYFDREITSSPYWKNAWHLAEKGEYDSLAAHFEQL